MKKAGQASAEQAAGQTGRQQRSVILTFFKRLFSTTCATAAAVGPWCLPSLASDASAGRAPSQRFQRGPAP
jgi:H+/Cl- antiporter ClcA